jgi:maleylpyruvate isomerase
VITLHGYYRSSASYRVRIALNLKNLKTDHIAHHLRKNEQTAPDYLKCQPQGLVPALQTDDTTLIQSMAIIEYLDETHPNPPLLPKDPAGRARVRALAQIICCDIHPVDNLRVLRYLRTELGQDEAAIQTWYNHWIAEGFAAFEHLLQQPGTGTFCHGDTPTLADLCLIPQIFNAGNYKLDLTPYPTIRRINEACQALPAFADAAPGKQHDSE